MSEPTRIETPTLDALFDEIARIKGSESYNRGLIDLQQDSVARSKANNDRLVNRIVELERDRDEHRAALSRLVRMLRGEHGLIPWCMDSIALSDAEFLLGREKREVTLTPVGGRCGWQGFASGLDGGCVLPAGHEGNHKFKDGSGGGAL